MAAVPLKKTHPGQRNSLDALCKRYEIDNSHRELHGALLDAEILSDVYLAMTGGQTALLLDSFSAGIDGAEGSGIRRLPDNRPALVVIAACEQELQAHNQRLDAIEQASGASVWRDGVKG